MLMMVGMISWLSLGGLAYGSDHEKIGRAHV
mgnify:CR=1 FL=1